MKKIMLVLLVSLLVLGGCSSNADIDDIGFDRGDLQEDQVEEVNINSFNSELNSSDIKALENASLEELKNEINTIKDFVYYKNEFYEPKSGNTRVDWKEDDNEHRWEFTEHPKSVISTKTANCASSANLAVTLLKNSVDKVGFIHEHTSFNIDNPGGHLISYVKQDGMYIIFDPQQAMRRTENILLLVGKDLDVMIEYYVNLANRAAIVAVVEGNEFYTIKTVGHSSDTTKNMRLRFPDYYENRTYISWEDEDDPLTIKFGESPKRAPEKYREFFEDREDHYLYDAYND